MTMASTTYALLVGIDRYLPPVAPLGGCVADIEALAALLEERVTGDGDRLELVTLLDERATRAAIIERFRTHLGRARHGDTALFAFAGHGSQASTAPELAHLEPDRLDETLVCHDSRRSGVFDLADKELSRLVAELADADPHVVLIVDACHSGSITRSLHAGGVRRVPLDTRPRGIGSYLAPASALAAYSATRSSVGTGGAAEASWTAPAAGRHVVLSACQADEEARERVFDGQTRGVFSHHLIGALSGANAPGTYRELFARVSARVRSSVAHQSPRIEASAPEELDRPFLGGAVRAVSGHHGVHHETGSGWFVEAGALHGIPGTSGPEAATFTLFAAGSDPFAPDAVPVGTASVRAVEPARTTLELRLSDDATPAETASFRAVLRTRPDAPLGVRLEGDAEPLGRVRARLAVASPGGVPSALVRETDAGGELVLSARDGTFRLRRADDERPLSVVVEDDDEGADGGADEGGRNAAGERVLVGAAGAVAALEHVARWVNLSTLENPATRLPPDAVTLEIHRPDERGRSRPVDPAANGDGLRLDYVPDGRGGWRVPTFRLRLHNRSERTLHCSVLDLNDRYAVSSGGFLDGGAVTLAPGESVWARGGGDVPVTVPDALWLQGLGEVRDVLKVIASTTRFEPSDFDQGPLGVRHEPGDARDIGGWNAGDTRDDWTTATLALTTTRPLPSRALPGRAGETVPLGDHVTVSGHAAFRASARLANATDASRDLAGARALPAWLRDDPTRVGAFDLAPNRGVGTELSTIELDGVAHADAVTADAPLRITVDAALAPGEHVLAVAWDAEDELYLPIGHGQPKDGRVEVRIDRLPEPLVSGRSLGGSIRIWFRKVVSTVLGREFEYPLLAAVDANGKRVTDPTEVAARVARAERVVLYVHGIIGDTESMAASAFARAPGQSVPPLGEHHDLVLAFDYENLDTTIQENGRRLGERLAAVGLGPGHERTLHVVAHSMGGLVSRWFVEREGGHRIVSHLVMLGTPNGGSPWSTVEDWVAAALGVGLNRLSLIAWPARVLGGLLVAFERSAGRSLAQMGIDSDFLGELERNPDPGIPYSIIAGNTSLIAAALAESDGQPKSLLRRLLGKLGIDNLVHDTASLAFFGKPNDVAVAVTAIGAVPPFAKLFPVRTVASDHMSYFAVDESLVALDAILSRKASVPAPAGAGTGATGDLPA